VQEQRNFAQFKKDWLADRNETRTTMPKFTQAQQQAKSHLQSKRGEKTRDLAPRESSLDDFVNLDDVRANLQRQAKEKRELKKLSKI